MASFVQASLAATAEAVPLEKAPAPPLDPATRPLASQPTASPQVDAQPVQSADPVDPMADYIRLQRRLMLATVMVSAVAVGITWAVFGLDPACSLFLGACCGLLYLRLLARSVSRLGAGSRSLGRLQLLVPCLLVIASSRIPAIHLLPAFIGFVLYKPALLLQAVLAP